MGGAVCWAPNAAGETNMVTFQRQVGLLKYRKIWFPNRERALEISRSLRSNEIVRFFGVAQELSPLPHLVKQRQLRTAWLDLSVGPEGMLKGMKRKSCRYEIRRAEKMLDRVEIEVDSERARNDFLVIYRDFCKAKGLPSLPISRLREFSDHAETFVIYLDQKPLCCHLLLCDSESSIVRLLHSGSRRLQNPEHAAACGALNRYLHWYEMQRYHIQGFATFDFGGILMPDDDFSQFKLSFGAVVVAEYYYLVSGSEWVARLGNLFYEKVWRRQYPATKTTVSSTVPDPPTTGLT